METKGIDLTKCKGFNFKADIDGTPCEGRIQVEDGRVYLCQDKRDGIDCIDKLGFEYSWCIKRGTPEDMKEFGVNVTDFEIVPRDPETYKDWQVGDVIYSLDDEGNTVSGEDEMCRVIFRSGELVAIAENYSAEEADINGCYTCSQLFREGWRLVLTDIEQQIIDKKKKYEPQDGDIVAWKDKEDDGDPAVSIYKERDRGYATIFATGLTEYSIYAVFAMNIIRPATDEEKQKLFEAMSKAGKRWNAEKKVVEDIPKPYEFRKGEPVLVRVDEFHRWIIAAYTSKDELGFIANAGVSEIHWKYCIPYNERTMHLLGTTDDYKEE